MSDFDKWLRETCFQAPPPEAEDLARTAWDNRQKVINSMAVVMRLMLTERHINRQAKRFLADHGLTGNPLREGE